MRVKRIAWGLVIQLEEDLTREEAQGVIEEMRRRIDDLYEERARPALAVLSTMGATFAEEAETFSKIVG
jgi:hypothetical protein